MVLVALGFAVLIFGGGMKAVTVIGLLIAAFNLGYELVFPILNIPDFADAVAGFLGIAIAHAFLLSLKRNGLMPKLAIVPLYSRTFPYELKRPLNIHKRLV